MESSTKRKSPTGSTRRLKSSKPAKALGADRRRKVEYGDFQTPPALADEVCRALAAERPATIVEPTCGTGNFLTAALHRFRSARRALALDVNPRYVAQARQHVAAMSPRLDCELRVANFFQTDWTALLADCPDPILIIGNLPWVTNSALGVLGSSNHPRKENRLERSGLDALTGKSNFDVSEWMILRLLEALGNRRGTLAMLCKTAVAQKVLAQVWQRGLPIAYAEVRRIDAVKHFAAHVDACLLVCCFGSAAARNDCRVFDALDSSDSGRAFGFRDSRLVADVAAYERVRHLMGSAFRWRSGVKHDCAAVFELRKDGRIWRNGLGEHVGLEARYMFPLLKSSQVASGDVVTPRRKLLVPQRHIGQETRAIAKHSPRTWRYLLRHKDRLDRRASAVYRNQPRFSVFGVGPYTFSKWKVVVSGFYKTWKFVPVGPIGNRPVLCDDTCYFLPCRSAAEAHRRAALLNSDRAREFFSAFVFSESKRPLTAEVLGLLDLDALAAERRI